MFFDPKTSICCYRSYIERKIREEVSENQSCYSVLYRKWLQGLYGTPTSSH